MHHTKLYSILKQIPFLKLGTVDNFQSLKEEITTYKDQVRYQPFIQETAGAVFKDEGYMNLDLSPIYENEFYMFNDTSETHIKKVSDYIKTNNGHYPEFELQETGLACPVATQTINHIIETPASCRLSRLPAGLHVKQHRHYFIDIVPRCTEIVLHIPVITNPKVIAKVSAFNRDDFHTTHFGEGELWYLNPWHFHVFENHSNEDRYHIWMNAYLNHPNDQPINNKLNQLLESAVRKYRGSWIHGEGRPRTHVEDKRLDFFKDFDTSAWAVTNK